jgi:hypothetical protein
MARAMDAADETTRLAAFKDHGAESGACGSERLAETRSAIQPPGIAITCSAFSSSGPSSS